MRRTQVKFDKFEMKSEIYSERLEFVGNYKLSGKLKSVPIKGEGRANISMIQMTSIHEAFGAYFTKPEDGETYLNITDYKIKFKPKLVTFDFENLFNGDQFIGKKINKSMKRNWKAVFDALVPEFERIFSEKIKNLSNNVFQKVPMKTIFLE